MPGFLELQLADSAFPSGAFAHSGGLEAAAQAGALTAPDALERWLHDALWQAGHASLPFVTAAHDDPGRLLELDLAQDAALPTTPLNRASRRQGRAHLDACVRAFGGPRLAALRERARAAGAPRHHAPVLGATLALLGLSRPAALTLHLHQVARGTLSAAVRLALAGPAEAQRLQARASPTLAAVLAACAGRCPADQCQVAPLHDLLAGGHDRLYSRLFTS
jgi:urease accessory protein